MFLLTFTTHELLLSNRQNSAVSPPAHTHPRCLLLQSKPGWMHLFSPTTFTTLSFTCRVHISAVRLPSFRSIRDGLDTPWDRRICGKRERSPDSVQKATQCGSYICPASTVSVRLRGDPPAWACFPGQRHSSPLATFLPNWQQKNKNTNCTLYRRGHDDNTLIAAPPPCHCHGEVSGRC